MQKVQTFKIEHKIPWGEVAELLSMALEGGSNYWYMIQKETKPKSWKFFGNYNKSKTKYSYLFPFNGGSLMIDDEVSGDPELKKPVKLDLTAIKKGLIAWLADSMKEDGDKTRSAHPCHLVDFLVGDADKTTADVFLQFCIFGKVIYG